MADVIDKLRSRPEIPVAVTDQDNAILAEKLAGSLTAMTLLQLQSERLRLSFVTIDGVAPTLDNFESGTYRYGKDIYLVTPSRTSLTRDRLIAFLRSEQGRAICVRTAAWRRRHDRLRSKQPPQGPPAAATHGAVERGHRRGAGCPGAAAWLRAHRLQSRGGGCATRSDAERQTSRGLRLSAPFSLEVQFGTSVRDDRNASNGSHRRHPPAHREARWPCPGHPWRAVCESHDGPQGAHRRRRRDARLSRSRIIDRHASPAGRRLRGRRPVSRGLRRLRLPQPAPSCA